MKIAHRFRWLIVAVLLASPLAWATPSTTDASDLWYNAEEPGWGLSVNQQDDTLFAVLFVYGPTNQPTWYVASNLVFTGTNASGGLVFTGQLYQTTGPWFAAATFNPAAVTVRGVGTATFTLTNLATATFVYSIDSATFSKNVVRQFWKTNNMSGSYLGGQTGTYSGCASGANNGMRDEPGTVVVGQSGNTATISVANVLTTCTYTGNYRQAGHFGEVAGTYSCQNGVTGSFNLFEVNAQISSLSARLATQSSLGCSYEGRVGGLRRLP